MSKKEKYNYARMLGFEAHYSGKKYKFYFVKSGKASVHKLINSRI
jgi:hypothetical protein